MTGATLSNMVFKRYSQLIKTFNFLVNGAAIEIVFVKFQSLGTWLGGSVSLFCDQPNRSRAAHSIMSFC